MEESVLCGGVELRLIDTAGIRETDDTVEQLGVERSRRAVAEADLVLVVVDISAIPTLEHDETLRLARASGKPFVVVFSKLDLYKPPAHVTVPGTGGDPAGAVYLSAVTGEGLQVLEDTVAGLLPPGQRTRRTPFSPIRRQEDTARRALDAVERARRPWHPDSRRTPFSLTLRRPWMPWANSPAAPPGRRSSPASSPASAWENKPPVSFPPPQNVVYKIT